MKDRMRQGGGSLQKSELPAQINNKNKQKPLLEQSTELVEGEEGARRRGDAVILTGCCVPGCSGRAGGCGGSVGVILEGPGLPRAQTHARKKKFCVSEKSKSAAKTRVRLPKFWPLPAGAPSEVPPKMSHTPPAEALPVCCASAQPHARQREPGPILPPAAEGAPPAPRWLPPRRNQWCLFSPGSDSSFRGTGWLHNCLLKRKPDTKQ